MVSNDKGITMIALVITVVLMAIILATISFSATTSLEIKALNSMYSDIRILDEKISMYYLKYGSLPVTDSTLVVFNKSININDNKNYYKIDVDLLEGVSLSYMKSDSPDDVYIVDEQSHTIYYQKGITLGEDTYYTIPLEYQKVEDI